MEMQFVTKPTGPAGETHPSVNICQTNGASPGPAVSVEEGQNFCYLVKFTRNVLNGAKRQRTEIESRKVTERKLSTRPCI